MPRLFTGLAVPDAIGQRLALHRGGLPGARWVEPADYHVTLRFLGDVERVLAEEVTAALAETRARPPLALTLDALEVFGGARPHSLYAQVAPSPALDELQAEHESLMRRLGLPAVSRKFTPHVTLARLRREANADAVATYLAQQGRFVPLAFTVEQVALYSARDSVGGGPYVVEAAYPLQGDGFEGGFEEEDIQEA